MILNPVEFFISPKGKLRFGILDNGCWPWLMETKNNLGYLKINGKSLTADRWLYEEAFGKIPSDKKLNKNCETNLCVNPDHMRLIAKVDKCQIGCKCKKHSSEFRKIVGNRNKIIHKGKIVSKETKSKMSASHMGKTMPPKSKESLAKQSESMKIAWENMSEETKIVRARKISESHINNPRIHNTFKATNLENYLEDLLIILNIKFKKQVWIGRACVDFLIEDSAISNKPIVLEVYGCYWHNCKRCQDIRGIQPRPEKTIEDLTRKILLEEKGYQVIEMWEHELPACSDGKVIF
jgi:very-short-patch-repair endonuclease